MSKCEASTYERSRKNNDSPFFHKFGMAMSSVSWRGLLLLGKNHKFWQLVAKSNREFHQSDTEKNCKFRQLLTGKKCEFCHSVAVKKRLQLLSISH